MHHSLRLYRHFRENALRYYIFQAKWTRIPIVGRLVRWVAQGYGRGLHRAYLLTPQEALQVVEASPRLWLGPCRCRRVFHRCNRPLDTEIMVGIGGGLLSQASHREYRPLSRQEAREVLESAHRQGLVFTLLRCAGDFYALCCCCPCCCVPWRLRRDYGIGTTLIRDPEVVSALVGQCQGVPAT